MSDDVNAKPIRVAVDVAEPTLRDRLFEAFSKVDEIELVPLDAPAEVRLADASGTATPPTGPELTNREEQVLLIMAEGASNREIADRLGISFHTAKFHVRSIMEKLDATGRVDAVAHAARLGVIHL